MKKTLKTEKVLEVYQVLSGAKYGKLEGDEQVKMVKNLLAFKPTAEKFEADTKAASDKLKEGFEGIDEKLQKANQYRDMLSDPNADASTFPMGPAEYHNFMHGEFAEFNKRVTAAVKSKAEANVSIEFEPISNAMLQKLMQSNSNWTIGQASILAIITEK